MPLCALPANCASKTAESANATMPPPDVGPDVRSKYDKNWDLNMQVSNPHFPMAGISRPPNSLTDPGARVSRPRRSTRKGTWSTSAGSVGWTRSLTRFTRSWAMRLISSRGMASVTARRISRRIYRLCREKCLHEVIDTGHEGRIHVFFLWRR